jgi:hypothetical protein
MKIKSTDRDAIVAQSIREMQFSRRYKQGKIRNWQKNEELYYSKKMQNVESRSNVDLGRMQEFVHTLLSKIDAPLIFKFQKRKESQLKRVKRLNSLRAVDQARDFWDMKDLVGKKQAIIYGRAAYCYYADSQDGYKAHLENIDVYDLLVDPAGGGIDVEQMLYWGRYGVVKSKEELEAGVKSKYYDKDETQVLIEGSGNNTESSQEETNKFVRMYGQNTIGKKELQSDEKYKFWEWYTTYQGKRYYLLLQSNAGRAIRVVPLDEMFTATKDFPLCAWPLWTWAAFPDLTEFWTPSYADYVREIFMNQHVTINQMNDNAEAINKPMKLVNINAIENLAELKYRRDGQIKIKGDIDLAKAYQTVHTPSIDTPIQVFNILEAIQEKASGVTATAKGVADEQGKVGIYEGNQQAEAGRFGLLNKSYAFGYQRFARLYESGVRDNLLKKLAIDMIGPDGIETEEVSRKDIFRKGDDFNVMVEASNAETIASNQQQTAKITFIQAQLQAQNANPMAPKIINAKKAFEIQAKVAGFNDDDIKELMDISEFGTEEVSAEAAKDIESLLDGEQILPNPIANTAYKQKLVDFLVDHQADMSPEQFNAMAMYIRSLDQVIAKNMARNLMLEKTKMLDASASAMINQPAPAPVAPVAPMMPPNGGAPQGLQPNPVQ